MNRTTYEILVVGGGHAGVEAAWASARCGCATALVTMDIQAIGRMSCNPAIGGLGKGQIVREIDALGGMMALAADAGGIQFRILNRSKGPAVQAPRAQEDRVRYARAVRDLLAGLPALEIVEGTVEEVLVTGDDRPVAAGVRLADGRELRARAVILTTGTFLSGLLHRGPQTTPGGRIDEPAAGRLSESLRRLGLSLGRLKTGTPPRVHRDSIDIRDLQVQTGDEPPAPFSFLTPALPQPQVVCWITHTSEQTHRIIRDNIHRAPMYSGQIKSRGPRYCPSIEDKVVRFPEKTSHQIFLEPEGYDTPAVYCNGISTSLPVDVQEAMVRSIHGLRRAEILQWGYAVEYDWIPTDQLTATLETRAVSGLFAAGQINGTSGYEEAAGQGLVAGLNAVAAVRRTEPLVLGRDQAYIGVMIDDLVTRPPDEPYRMFTSRAEYRLHLRCDNADMRLTPLGRKLGLVDQDRWAAFQARRACLETLEACLQAARLDGRSLQEWLQRPGMTLRELATHAPGVDLAGIPPSVIEAVEIRARYAGYLRRELVAIERFRRLESRAIPDSMDFGTLTGLRFEAREKLSRFRPRNLGQAARISGISPADIATLSLYLR